MRQRHDIFLEPGAELKDRLFELGVEFPCGGESNCGACRVRVLSGDIAITDEMRATLTDEELRDGWRLACCASGTGLISIETAEWTPSILTDEARVEVEPREGLGVAIDLGTTTLVAQLVDLETGEIVGVETALNPQARYGADLMTRIQAAMREPDVLTALIRACLGQMVKSLASGRTLREVLLCGNTVMHHLFCGHDVSALSVAPFRTPTPEARVFKASELDWDVSVTGGVTFLPCLGGFVGSDLLTGMVACGLHGAGDVEALIDLGTNGEIVLRQADGSVLCASTAAGPAFEGGRISQGMRAGSGAIDSVHLDGNKFECHVLGGGAAVGLCGSGLVDAAAALLDGALVQVSGRLRDGAREAALTDTVKLTQQDIRELQLAKGAIAAGLTLLLEEAGASALRRIHLAGAFGNYIRVRSAKRIGLLPGDVHVEPAGNAALRGTRELLLAPSRRDALISRIVQAARHVELSATPDFEMTYAMAMRFDAPGQ